MTLQVLFFTYDQSGQASKNGGKKMTTVETTKAIRAELKAAFPAHKFSVRKVDCGVVHIEFNGDKAIREAVNAIAQKFTGWSEFNTDYVFVNPCRTLVEEVAA